MEEPISGCLQFLCVLYNILCCTVPDISQNVISFVLNIYEIRTPSHSINATKPLFLRHYLPSLHTTCSFRKIRPKFSTSKETSFYHNFSYYRSFYPSASILTSYATPFFIDQLIYFQPKKNTNLQL